MFDYALLQILGSSISFKAFMESVPQLPIQTTIPELRNALRSRSAVLAAPPGSGKTTLVPLTAVATRRTKKDMKRLEN